MLRWVVLCVAIVLVKAQTTQVSNCTEGGERPYNAYVEDCDVPPCRVRSGEHAVIHIIFRAPSLMWNMTSSVKAQMAPIPILLPWDLGPESVTCNFLTNSYCPVLAGEVLQYTLRMQIPSGLPSVTATIEFTIQDESENRIMCIRLPVSVFA